MSGEIRCTRTVSPVSRTATVVIEEGRGRYGLRLWMLITLELWRRIVVEGESV